MRSRPPPHPDGAWRVPGARAPGVSRTDPTAIAQRGCCPFNAPKQHAAPGRERPVAGGARPGGRRGGCPVRARRPRSRGAAARGPLTGTSVSACFVHVGCHQSHGRCGALSNLCGDPHRLVSRLHFTQEAGRRPEGRGDGVGVGGRRGGRGWRGGQGEGVGVRATVWGSEGPSCGTASPFRVCSRLLLGGPQTILLSLTTRNRAPGKPPGLHAVSLPRTVLRTNTSLYKAGAFPKFRSGTLHARNRPAGRMPYG